MTVAEYLKQHLLEGRSVTQAAKLLMTTRANLSNVINGNRYLSVDMAMKVGQVYGLDAHKLLHDQLDEQIEARYRHEKDRSRSHASAARPARPRRNARVGLLRVGR